MSYADDADTPAAVTAEGKLYNNIFFFVLLILKKTTFSFLCLPRLKIKFFDFVFKFFGLNYEELNVFIRNFSVVLMMRIYRVGTSEDRDLGKPTGIFFRKCFELFDVYQ